MYKLPWESSSDEAETLSHSEETCSHASQLFTPVRKSLWGVNGTFPPGKAAAESGRRAGSAADAVLAARARALAGAGACCTLGRRGRAYLLVSDDRQEACERVQHVLWALEGPYRTVAGASWVL